MIIKSKRPTTAFGPRPVYMNGLLIGHLYQRSDHFRGREFRKTMLFVPLDSLPWRLSPMSEPGWVLKHMHQNIEDQVFSKARQIESFVRFARVLAEG